jgi:putative ABC transport system ATP-binding protein
MNDTDTATTPTYRLAGVGRRYGSGDAIVDALSSVDLEIGSGSYTVIAGPSGSGKSTLLQLLGALDRPTTGSIEFEGRELGSMSEAAQADLRREAIGFVFQQFNLIPTLTAAENIEIALDPSGLDKPVRQERIAELLDRVGLGGRADHLPSQLSGGEQQRVAIARSLANRPRVLLADEPTGNLDSKNGEAVLELIRGLWLGEGLTVVLITHDASITADAPRLVRIADGEIVPDAELTGAGVSR